MSGGTQDVLERIERDGERYIEELEEYLRIPSISTDPAHRDDVRRCAEWLRERMEVAGLEAELIETEGHPLVYGEWTGAPGKPTVLFYGHYDVQPVDPLDLWETPPFEPRIADGRIYARGATDDKGQSYTHLKAVEAMLAVRGELPVNVKFLIEGEEESGGAAIEAYVQEDGGRRLACDCVVISDSGMFAPGQPALTYALRGLAYLEVKVKGPKRDLHSGSYGGSLVNPLNALAHILARLWDPETGKVLIPGFYDDVQPLEDWEREEFAGLDFDEEAYRAEMGGVELLGEEGFTTLERIWARPTLDVNGVFGGYQGAGAKTVIGAWGGAKVSMRLVADQESGKVSRLAADYIREIAPCGVEVEVKEMYGAAPFRLDPQGPFAEAALAAMRKVWEKDAVRIREGGSIPIVATFEQVLEVPILLMGLGLPDDALHSPNESFRIDNFYDGIRMVAQFLDLLAAGE